MKLRLRRTEALTMAVVAVSALWPEIAAADDAALDALVLGDGAAVEMLSPDELAAASGGANTTQTTMASQGLNFSKNDVSAGNGQINTGTITSQVGNSGGVNSVMLNSGNNVSFQNSTQLNIYLGQNLP